MRQADVIKAMGLGGSRSPATITSQRRSWVNRQKSMSCRVDPQQHIPHGRVVPAAAHCGCQLPGAFGPFGAG